MNEDFSPDSALVAQTIPSPNFNSRKEYTAPELIILHYTGMKTAAAALDRLCDPRAEVSCHYFVDEAGSIFQLVQESHRAWHAGKAIWQGKEDLNSNSIGIEIVNPGHEFGYADFPKLQIDAVVLLLRDILKRTNIHKNAVLAHSDIAPLRKEDPGEKFPWDYLAKNGIGEWVSPTPRTGDDAILQLQGTEEILAWQKYLAEFGFGIEFTGCNDPLTQACTKAFQRRFRQQLVDGIADQSTISTMESLLNARQ